MVQRVLLLITMSLLTGFKVRLHKRLSDDPGCFGKLDGIRRRLTTGFTVEIVKL